MESLATAILPAAALPLSHGIMLLGLEYFYFIGEKEGLPLHLHRVGRIIAAAGTGVPFVLVAGPN